MGELVSTFALGQDNAFGQPLESQLRSGLLATWLAEAMDLDAAVRATTYWAAQLRYVGCTGHAYEVEVLRLAAQGLTTRQIATQLVISAKTADSHIQHIYTKIGVSTRGAAALVAIQNDLVRGGLD
jgi:DNA-binding CsgD family transcriptional regulator